MRYVWITFLSLAALLLGLLGWSRLHPAPQAATAAVAPAPVVAVVSKRPAPRPAAAVAPTKAIATITAAKVAPSPKATAPTVTRAPPAAAPAPALGAATMAPAAIGVPALPEKTAAPAAATPALPGAPRAAAIVAFAEQQLGAPYCWAGVTPAGGFDCSGFIRYVFGEFAIDVPHSTALLIDVGREVPRATAQPGDIVVFTGTAPTATTPGHAGIVLSGPGEPLRFIHASSARRESGVKISTVEGSGYERRFLAVRRVL